MNLKDIVTPATNAERSGDQGGHHEVDLRSDSAGAQDRQEV